MGLLGVNHHFQNSPLHLLYSCYLSAAATPPPFRCPALRLYLRRTSAFPDPRSATAGLAAKRPVPTAGAKTSGFHPDCTPYFRLWCTKWRQHHILVETDKAPEESEQWMTKYPEINRQKNNGVHQSILTRFLQIGNLFFQFVQLIFRPLTKPMTSTIEEVKQRLVGQLESCHQLLFAPPLSKQHCTPFGNVTNDAAHLHPLGNVTNDVRQKTGPKSQVSRRNLV